MYFTRIFAGTALACSLVIAAPPMTPVAKVSTAQGLQINGTPTPSKAAPTWPVMVNDKVTTGASPTVLMLTNRDRALIEPQTSVQLGEQRPGVLALNVLSGLICLHTIKGSALEVMAAGERVAIPDPFEGSIDLRATQGKPTVTVGDCRARIGGFLANHKVVIPAAGAAATAGAVAAGSAITSASPIR